MAKETIFKVKDVVGFSLPGDEDTYQSRMLVDPESVGSEKVSINHFTLKPGKSTSSGSHPEPYEEVYYILRGKARLTIGDETREVGPDTVGYIHWGTNHQLVNIGETDLEILTIWQLPIREGANPIYDERKRVWGTSFKKVNG